MVSPHFCCFSPQLQSVAAPGPKNGQVISYMNFHGTLDSRSHNIRTPNANPNPVGVLSPYPPSARLLPWASPRRTTRAAAQPPQRWAAMAPHGKYVGSWLLAMLCYGTMVMLHPCCSYCWSMWARRHASASYALLLLTKAAAIATPEGSRPWMSQRNPSGDLICMDLPIIVRVKKNWDSAWHHLAPGQDTQNWCFKFNPPKKWWFNLQHPQKNGEFHRAPTNSHPLRVDWLWIGIPCRLSEGPWGWPVMSSHIIPEKCLSEKKGGQKKNKPVVNHCFPK